MSLFRHWKTALGLVALFVAGVVTGGVLTIGVMHRIVQHRANPETWAPRTIEWFRKEVHITPEQESQLRPIVDDAISQMKKLRGDADQQWREIIAQMLHTALPILDDHQRQQMRDAVRRAQLENIHRPLGRDPRTK
ncbi:MAG TPA: hypothetical protein VHV77_01195 [Pirellulales bacterium]|nr:hypothetical protein [Pirellulales bacterium]